MGRKLPGSPVVGFFDTEDQDFKGHEREIIVRDGKYEVLDITRPYGFVPTDAEVWFEKYDDEGTIHEYLCCDVYIWTGAYPESQRILDRGNNQSMEIRNISGFWTNDDKTHARIFIYNEALIEKLCILGENVEPCFEGASITRAQEAQFSYSEFQEFKNQVYSILEELQTSKGGSQNEMEDQTNVIEEAELQEGEITIEGTEDTNVVTDSEEACGDATTEPAAAAISEPAVCYEYPVESAPEYIRLKNDYQALEEERVNLLSTIDSLKAENEELKKFKLVAERADKQNMIDSFYMLSDDDKADVIQHIDAYSVDEIEAKLAIICVRNKVSFSDQNASSAPAVTGLFELQNEEEDSAPAWIKAVRDFKKN